MGATSILPVYVYYYGLEGFLLSLLVITLIAVGCVFMVPFAIFVAGVCHRVSESWRIINIVRPIVMILMGVYYPRFYIPLTGYVIGSLIPSSFIVEIIQRTLLHLETNTYLLLAAGFALFFLYLPAGSWSIKAWEAKKVREGVKIS
jgi:ABC-2 type transport system permease protein